LSIFFALLGSERIKAAHISLVKLTLIVQKISKIIVISGNANHQMNATTTNELNFLDPHEV